MYKYLVAVSLEPDHEKIRAYCDGSVEHFNWLEDLGFQFERSFYPGKIVVPPGTEGLSYTGNEKVCPFTEKAKPAPRGHSVPVPGELGGAAMVIDLLVKRADELGVQVRYETGATNLVVDDGAVVGVGWKHFTETGAIKAKSVIIAAGGFAMNPEMVAEHTPALGQKRRTKHHGVVEPYILGNPNDDGLGIRLGVSAGGVAENLDQMFITAAAYPPEILLTGIIVNKDGERFVTEDSYHSRTSAFVLEQPDQIAYLIVDEEHMQMPEMPLIQFIDGWETVEEMESRAGNPGRQAGRDPDRYNEHAARGRGSRLPQAAGIRCAADERAVGGVRPVARAGDVLRLHHGRTGGDDRRRGPARRRQRDPRSVCRGRVRVQHRPGRQGLLERNPVGRGLVLRPPRRNPRGAGLDRLESPGAVAEQLQPSVVVLVERRTMADADHDAVRQLAAQRAVQRELLAFVERRGRLVEEDRLRFLQQHTGERDALLLAGRQHLRPVGHLVEPAAQVPERHGVEGGPDLVVGDIRLPRAG